MKIVEVSRLEMERRQMKPATLQAAVEAMNQDGVVLLPEVINIEHIDVLGEKMQADIRQLEISEGISNNWAGVRPPPFAPYLFKDIIYNEMAISVTRQLMGDGVFLDSYGTNTAFVGDQMQGIHADTYQLWPNLTVNPPPHCIVVNVCLVDMDETNGGTKVWLGTHADKRILANNRHISEEMVAEWELKRPSEQVQSRKGDLILRDMRDWHCGMPNTTDRPRPMLAMIHRQEWAWKWGFEAEQGCEDFFDHPILSNTAVFVDAPINYLHQGHSKPKFT